MISENCNFFSIDVDKLQQYQDIVYLLNANQMVNIPAAILIPDSVGTDQTTADVKIALTSEIWFLQSWQYGDLRSAP